MVVLRTSPATASRGFAVVGYGKLGGWELGYSSDLDLVFLHDCPDDAETDGECVIRWPPVLPAAGAARDASVQHAHLLRHLV